MHVYPGYVSAESTNPPQEKVLIVGLNWLGDSLMAMPAIQAYRRIFPEKRLVILVKPRLAELWPMHPAIDDTWVCPETLSGIWKTAGKARAAGFSTAFILPQSFRSALVPFLAHIPRRIGPPGHYRHRMLTQTVAYPQESDNIHQQYEYMAVFGVKADPNELPVLNLDNTSREKARAILGQDKGWIGLLPGAARGAAKCWPADYFSALGRILRKDTHCNIIVFGSATDQNLCARICGEIGKETLNLAGRTSLSELAALFSQCAAVIGNDSGGAHLAAAMGTAVIVIFGITNPAKTKPLGLKVTVLQDSLLRSRDVARASATAEASLKKISPELVAEKTRALIGR